MEHLLRLIQIIYKLKTNLYCFKWFNNHDGGIIVNTDGTKVVVQLDMITQAVRWGLTKEDETAQDATHLIHQDNMLYQLVVQVLHQVEIQVILEQVIVIELV